MSGPPPASRPRGSRARRAAAFFTDDVGFGVATILLCGAGIGIGYLVGGSEGAIGGFFIGAAVAALGFVLSSAFAAVVLGREAVRWWRRRS